MDSLRKQPPCLDATTSSLTSEERLICVNLPRGTTNQKYYPDLGSVTCHLFLDLISRTNQCWSREMSAVFLAT